MNCRRCDAELQLGRKLTLCAACRRDQLRGRNPYDKSGDKPAGICKRRGCTKTATWRDPIRGCGWIACDDDKLEGDEPIEQDTGAGGAL